MPAKAVMLAIAAVAASLSAGNALEPEPRACKSHLLTVNGEGAVLRGSKAKLAAAVEQGHAIRVGFGLGEGETGGYFLTHWFEATFLTVLGENVFTQTPQIHRQRPDAQAGDVFLTQDPQIWVATMGTNGKLHSRFLNSDDIDDHSVTSWWCRAD